MSDTKDLIGLQQLAFENIRKKEQAALDRADRAMADHLAHASEIADRLFRDAPRLPLVFVPESVAIGVLVFAGMPDGLGPSDPNVREIHAAMVSLGIRAGAMASMTASRETIQAVKHSIEIARRMAADVPMPVYALVPETIALAFVLHANPVLVDPFQDAHYLRVHVAMDRLTSNAADRLRSRPPT